MALSAILLLTWALQGVTPDPAAFMRVTYGVTETEMATADLNGDGRDEVIVRATNPERCGSGGCALFVLTPEGGSFRAVMEATVTHVPVRALEARTNGWKDLAVTVSGGGIRTPRQVRLRFDGLSYPDNPTVVRSDDVSASEGAVLLSDIVVIPMKDQVSTHPLNQMSAMGRIQALASVRKADIAPSPQRCQLNWPRSRSPLPGPSYATAAAHAPSASARKRRS